MWERDCRIGFLIIYNDDSLPLAMSECVGTDPLRFTNVNTKTIPYTLPLVSAKITVSEVGYGFFIT